MPVLFSQPHIPPFLWSASRVHLMACPYYSPNLHIPPFLWSACRVHLCWLHLAVAPASCWKAASRSFQVSKVSDYQFAVKKLSWCHGLAQWGGPEGQPQKCQSCYIGTSWPQKCHISTKAHYIKRWSYWIVILILLKIKYLDKNFVIIKVLSELTAI